VLQAPAEKAPEQLASFVAKGVAVATGANLWSEPVKTDSQAIEATDATDTQTATNEGSARTELTTPPKRAARWQWQPDAVTDRTEPRAAPNGASARTDPVGRTKRAARWQWD